MAEYENEVRRILKENNCVFVRHGKGDYDFWYSPVTDRNVTVDTKIKSRYTVNAIMKQNGIKFRFR